MIDSAPVYSITLPLREFFKETNNLVIPDFQRTYTWSRKDIEKFLKSLLDITQEEDEEKCHYIGEIVLASVESDAKVNSENWRYYQGNKWIIDGQQRTITLQLATAALNFESRFYLEKLKKIFSNDEINNWQNISLTAVPLSNVYGDDKSGNDIVNIANDPDKEGFSHIYSKSVSRTCKEWLAELKPFSKNKIVSSFKNCIEYFENELEKEGLFSEIIRIIIKNNKANNEEYTQISNKINEYKKATGDEEKADEALLLVNKHRAINYVYECLQDKIFLTKIFFVDPDSAFTVFEDVNTLGVKLTSFNLVRGFIASNTNKSDKAEISALNSFDVLVNKINEGRDDNLKVPNNYLSFWLESMNSGTKVNSSSMYSFFKEKFNNEFQNNVVSVLKSINECFDFYNQYLVINPGYPAAISDILKYTQVVPLFYIVSKFSGTDLQKTQFLLSMILIGIIKMYILGNSPTQYRYIMDDIKIALINKLATNSDKKLPSIYELFNDENLTNVMSLKDELSRKNSQYTVNLSFNKKQNEEQKLLYFAKDMGYEDFKMNKAILYFLMFDDDKQSKPNDFSQTEIEHCLAKKINVDKIPVAIKKDKTFVWSNEIRSKADWAKNKYVNYLGNLTIIEKKTNIKISNKWPEDKAELFNTLAQKMGDHSVLNRDWNTVNYVDLVSPDAKEIIIKRSEDTLLLFKERILLPLMEEIFVNKK